MPHPQPHVWLAQLQYSDDTTRELDWIALAATENAAEELLNTRAASELSNRFGPHALIDPANHLPECDHCDFTPSRTTPLQLWCCVVGAKYDICRLPLPTP